MGEERKLIERLRLLSEEPDDSYSLAADALESALAREQEALSVLRGFYIEALNGRICSPPETGDPFLGQEPNPDGKINLFDIEALHCGSCKSLWRRTMAALAAVPVETQEAAERCGNAPDEEGNWPCDPVANADGTATCSVCGREGLFTQEAAEQTEAT